MRSMSLCKEEGYEFVKKNEEGKGSEKYFLLKQICFVIVK